MLHIGGLFGVLGIMGPKTLQDLIFIDFCLILNGFWEGLAPQQPHKILFLSFQMPPEFQFSIAPSLPLCTLLQGAVVACLAQPLDISIFKFANCLEVVGGSWRYFEYRTSFGPKTAQFGSTGLNLAQLGSTWLTLPGVALPGATLPGSTWPLNLLNLLHLTQFGSLTWHNLA